MKLFLGSNESLIGFLVEGNIPEDGCSYERANLMNLSKQRDTDGSTVMEVVGLVRTTWGGLICCR